MQMQASANFRIHWQTGYVHHPFPKSLPTVERVLKVEMRNVTGGRHANNENFNSIAYYGSRSSEIQHVGWFQWNFPVDVIVSTFLIVHYVSQIWRSRHRGKMIVSPLIMKIKEQRETDTLLTLSFHVVRVVSSSFLKARSY